MFIVTEYAALRNEFDFWTVHGIMYASGLLQSKWSPNVNFAFMIPWIFQKLNLLHIFTYNYKILKYKKIYIN